MMKIFIYKTISFITFILALLCFVGMKTVDGGGFLDLSNLARYAFAVLAAIMAIISVVLAMKAKLMKREEEQNKDNK